jgi:hypothetical protein
MAIKLADGNSRVDAACCGGCAKLVGAAICDRNGQSGGLARKLGVSSLASHAGMSPAQWWFPFLRQHAGVEFPVAAKASGPRQPHATTESTKLATSRRMVIRER